MSEKQLARVSLALSIATVANVAALATNVVESIAGGDDVSNRINGELLNSDAIINAVQARMFHNLKMKGAV